VLRAKLEQELHMGVEFVLALHLQSCQTLLHVLRLEKEASICPLVLM
jgi:hypothetical protein